MPPSSRFLLLLLLLSSVPSSPFNLPPLQLAARAPPSLSRTKLSNLGSSPSPSYDVSYDEPYRRLSVTIPKLKTRLNLFGLVYGSLSVALGIIWSLANLVCWLSYFFFHRVLRVKAFDRARRIPVWIAHCWGYALLKATRCDPKIVVREGGPKPVGEKREWRESRERE